MAGIFTRPCTRDGAVCILMDSSATFKWRVRCVIMSPTPAAPLLTHASTHSDDITALHFYRPSASTSSATAGNGSNNLLLSVSSDGLVCTSRADEADEDEAGVHVANWGCSVAQAGWLHDRAGRPGVWAASDMETFSVWSAEVCLLLSCPCPHLLS